MEFSPGRDSALVVPTIMEAMMTDKDKARRERVFAAVMKMIKLNIAELESAFKGE
jgi:predicted 3-demethylubiquinone-9 3-methyltransferase (glyoxalase superfamily)